MKKAPQRRTLRGSIASAGAFSGDRVGRTLAHAADEREHGEIEGARVDTPDAAAYRATVMLLNVNQLVRRRGERPLGRFAAVDPAAR
jgi:hypothetical protein